MRKPALARRASSAAIAAALLFAPVAALAQGFVGTPTTVSGSPTFSGSGTTGTVTVPASIPQTIINWTPTGTISGNVVNFLPSGQTENFVVNGGGAGSVYTILNRIIPSTGNPAAGVFGNITSAGNVRVWLYSPGGLLIGPNATINVGGLVLTAADPVTTTNPASGLTTFVNTAAGTESFSLAAASGSTAAITIQSGAQINVAANTGATYMVAIAPQISHAGTISVSGSSALVAAESASFSVDPTGLFNITVNSGTTVSANTFTSTGNIGSSDSVADNAASVRRVYLVAVPKNNAITMAISAGGDVGFAAAGAAAMEGNTIVLSEGLNIADSTSGLVTQVSAAGAGTSSLTIGGGTYSSNVRAYGTGSIAVTDSASSITFLSNLALTAPQTAINAAIGTIGVAGNLTLTSDNTVSAINNANIAQVTVASGATLAVGTNAVVLKQNGDLTVTANDPVYANAGTASVAVTGGTLSVAGNVTLAADASWANAATQSNPGGIYTNAGNANLTVSGGGSATIGGNLSLSANADGTAAAAALTVSPLIPDTGVTAAGGYVQVTATGAGSALKIGANLTGTANAIGGTDNTVASGGDATGGMVHFDADTGGTLAVGGTGQIAGSATAAAGAGSSGSGGSASGGTAQLIANAATITQNGATAITLAAGATGGAATAGQATGGAAAGGNAAILVSGAAASLATDTSGSVGGSAGVTLDASASGGSGTFNGSNGLGGAARGGAVRLSAASAGDAIRIGGAGAGVNLIATGVGGAGNSLGGGAGTGGSIGVTTVGSQLAITGTLSATAAGSGGADILGPGGTGTGGLVQLTTSGGSNLSIGGLNFIAAGLGGNGYSNGGDAVGGNALISAQGSLGFTTAAFDTSYTAGTGLTPGNATSAGGAKITAGGNVTLRGATAVIGNTALLIEAGGNIGVTGTIIGNGADAYLQLYADTGGTGTGTVTLSSGAVNLSGTAAAVDIYYNPGALGTPTNFAPGVAAGTLTAYQLVDTITQLQSVGSFLTQNFALGRNIDATQTQGWNGGAGFVPIGTPANPFAGNFDGLAHTVTGLWINTPTSAGVGLFGAVESAGGNAIVIRNVGLVNPVIVGASQTGGLIGAIPGTGCVSTCGPIAVANAFVTGQYGAITGTGLVGGLVGDSEQTSGILLTAVHADIAVNGTGNSVGGLIGKITDGIITRSWATGAVSDPGAGASGVGGLIGDTSATISQVYATGAVTAGAGASNIGGLIGNSTNSGRLSPTIAFAYATGAVTAGANATNVGGLVGQTNYAGFAIDESWASGAVTTGAGSSNVAGLVGNNLNPQGTIFNSYWDSFSTRQAAAVGGANANNTVNVGPVTSDPTQSAAANYALRPTSYTNFSAASWVYEQSATRPLGAWEVPAPQFLYATVSSAHQVQLVDLAAQAVATQAQATGVALPGGYTLTQSIDLSGTSNLSDIWGGLGLVPIGVAIPFAQTFNGNGFVLSNLLINPLNYEQQGLFASTAGTINDLGIWNGRINSQTGTAAQAGLLAAQNTGTIFDSFATGTVVAAGAVAGGLVGYNSGTIVQTYANAAVSGYSDQPAAYAGGLVGQNVGAIGVSYANGSVLGTNAGGLVGANGTNGTIGASYYDSVLSGQAGACGSVSTASCSAVTALTTAQTQQSASFSAFSIDTSGGQGLPWRQYDGQTTPLLSAFLQPILVQPDSLSTVYTASLPSIGVTTYGANAALLFGSPVTTGGNQNAGTYAIGYQGGLYSNQIGYDLVASTTPGTLIIAPAPLTLSPSPDSRSYDATTASGGAVGVSGLQGNDTVTNLTQVFDSPNAGSRLLLVNAGYVINDGNGGHNYSVTTGAADGSITPAPLTIAATADSRSYNATTASAATPTVSGLFGNDSVSGLAQAFDSANAGARTLSVSTGYVVNDGNGGGNYTVSLLSTGGAITPAALTIAASADSRSYNATTASVATPTVSGLFGSDSVSGLAQAFDSANAGARTLSVSTGYVVNDGNAGGNYAVTTLTAAGRITPAPLTLAAVPDTRTYDATINSAAVPLATGLQGADTISLLYQQFSSANAGARTLSVGAGYQINDGNNGLNYTVTTSTAAGTITPAPLTLSAVTDSRSYNATNASAGTPVASGLFGSDTVTGLSQTFDSANAGARTLSVSAGYTVNDGNGGGNYTVVTAPATGAITPAPLAVSYIAAPASSVYGNTIGSLSGSVQVQGLQGNDTAAQVLGGSAAFGSSASASSPVGSYAITGSGLSAASGNYSVSFAQSPANATALTITARPIDVTALDQYRPVDSANPALAYTVTGPNGAAGLVNGDQLTGALTTTATITSAPGTYAITQGTLAASSNYALSFTPGTLTVTQATPNPNTYVITDTVSSIDTSLPGGSGGGFGGGGSGGGGHGGSSANGENTAGDGGPDDGSTPLTRSVHAGAVAAIRAAVLPVWSPGPMIDPPPLKTPPPVTEPVSINGQGGKQL